MLESYLIQPGVIQVKRQRERWKKDVYRVYQHDHKVCDITYEWIEPVWKLFQTPQITLTFAGQRFQIERPAQNAATRRLLNDVGQAVAVESDRKTLHYESATYLLDSHSNCVYRIRRAPEMDVLVMDWGSATILPEQINVEQPVPAAFLAVAATIVAAQGNSGSG